MRRRAINPLEVPNYTIHEAARYLHVPPTTLSYWVLGGPTWAPLTSVYTRTPLLLSFKNLVECFVLESLRNSHGLSIKNIRNSIQELRQETPSKYPLADHQLATTKRGEVYLEGDGDQLIKLRPGRQQAFKQIMEPYLRRVDRNTKGIAERLFPFTRTEHQKAPAQAPSIVVIDPRIAYGKPVLINSRLPIAFLLSRYRGGTSIAQLASDYGREKAEIEEAIFLEQSTAA